MESNDMRVTKRNGELEEIAFDKILIRIKKLGQEANIHINYQQLVMKVIDQLYDTIPTTKIDELAAEQCASMSTLHPDYGTLAGRIIVSNHQKNTDSDFSNVMMELYNFYDIHGKHNPLVSQQLFSFVNKFSKQLNEMIIHERDFYIDYFGFKTLERAYLFKKGNSIIERPQYMWMRVAIGIHGQELNENSLGLIKETYDLMSQKYFTHATPTLFNAGTPRSQLSSCYLIAMEDDSLDGIYNTLKDCALISKYAGGIGLHIHNIRAKGTHIHGTNGTSNGLIPMLRVFNNTARYVDQCVHPETIIYTTNGPLQIQNCSFGETKIFNLTGNCETIENVLEHPYEGEIYNIETMHCIDNLKITPEHPIFVLRNQTKGINYNVIKNRIEKNLINFEWIEAKELDLNDMIIYSIPQCSDDIINISTDDCFMYGIILGDGSMSNEDQNGYISLHTYNKKHLLDFAINYFENKCVQYRIETNENTTRIRWNKNINMPFRYNDIYDVNKEKRVLSKWLNLPIEKSKYVLKGLLETDGCNNTELVFDNTSRNLIESVRFICLKMGILTSGYIRDRDGESHQTKNGIITNKKISYCLRIPKTEDICKLMNINYNDKQFYKFLKYKNYLLTRIKDIKKEEYNGTLYDLQMKNEHNYMLHNGIVHNGGGKRNGSFAIYLEPWHADIFDFLELRKNHGDEELKARDLFYALWISDLFMERVKEKNGKWSLFCPHECPGLSDVYGDDFVKLYEKYEQEGKARKTIIARDLWFAILDAQMETGTPYILYKDACNKKSNQKNIGTIKSSNLCTEVVQYSDDKETAVCNLASIALPAFVNQQTKQFDYDKLHEITKVVTNNLNKVIDINFYPTVKTKLSNFRHRPIGIGVQGLADAFILMDIPFHSDDAKLLNKNIFETIYHAALEKSNEMALQRTKIIKELKAKDRFSLMEFIPEEEYDCLSIRGEESNLLGAYTSFEGSPASKGILQFDMWSIEPSNRYDWAKLKQSIIENGLRNSLLIAPMPTASTSQILGYNECFEPLTSNIYSRRTLAGEFVVVNKYLMKELINLGLWNEQIKNNIIANQGSVQQLSNIPEHIRNKYKIVWEIPMKHLIDMAADRGAFICQSQSLNLWMEDPVYNKLTSMHFYAWDKGLKTGIYYLRRKAKHQAQQFTIEPENKVEKKEEICEMCSA
jgi:ribonucleotide reductase alpha subunit/intein/homing endonuclease